VGFWRRRGGMQSHRVEGAYKPAAAVQNPKLGNGF